LTYTNLGEFGGLSKEGMNCVYDKCAISVPVTRVRILRTRGYWWEKVMYKTEGRSQHHLLCRFIIDVTLSLILESNVNAHVLPVLHPTYSSILSNADHL